MNPPISNPGPRWAIYLKTAAVALPALAFWMFSCVLLVPKLKEICVVSHTNFPAPILTALALSEAVKNNLIVASVGILAVLVWLEWRSHRWPRYRHLVFGVLAYSLNLVTLAILTALCVLAVLAGANLLHAK